MTRKEAAELLISIAVYRHPVPISNIFCGAVCGESGGRFLDETTEEAMRQDIAKSEFRNKSWFPPDEKIDRAFDALRWEAAK